MAVPEVPKDSLCVYGGVDIIVPGYSVPSTGLKDLVIGRADECVALYLNIAADEAPAFDGGWFLQVGQPGTKVDIDVGVRATPTVVDWNSDGTVRLYRNLRSIFADGFESGDITFW